MQIYDVIIIGTGPAGVATARALSRMAPGVAARTLMIDRVTHPRAGGYSAPVTGASLKLLESLELSVEVPSLELTRARFRYGDQVQDVYFEAPWMLVERSAFDAWLFNQTAQAVETRQGEEVRELSREGDLMRVETDQRSYRAKLVVGADGTDSLVREHIWRHHDPKGEERASRGAASHGALSFGRAQGSGGSLEAQGCLEYDFTPLSTGANGYVWHTEGASGVHAGLVQHESSEGEAPGEVLDGWVASQDWVMDEERGPTKTHRKRHHDPSSPLSSPRTLLVGEAAGVEPLLGDGLWQCLEYGCLAAHAVQEAIERGEYGLEGYTEGVHRSMLGREMVACQRLGERLFGDDWRFWVSLLVNRQALPSLLTRQESGVETVHQKRLYLTMTSLLHRLLGDKRLVTE